MPSGPPKKTFVFLVLGLLTVSAFFMRLENFKHSQLRTIDEIVYYRMAKQVLDEGLSGYHTIPYGEDLAASGRSLPDYFFQPLFKHPPVFTILIAASMKVFGANLVSAGYVSIALGVLMIPLIYFLGSYVYDKRVGILAAIFLWIDPINTISSQKVWMDTTIAFFVLLTALFFVMGLKRNNDLWFIFSGLAGGLAVNTKYTGILIILIIPIYCLLHHRNLFVNKIFQFSLLAPFLLLTPWLYWNYQVYGITSVLKHRELQLVVTRLSAYMPILTVVVVVLLLLFFIFMRRKKKFPSEKHSIEVNAGQEFTGYLSIIISLVFFIFIIPKQFLHSLQFNYLPTHSWHQGIFFGAPPSFYFGRMLEFSPLYIFSFLTIFLYHPNEKSETSFIRLCAIGILLFFIFWGSYQSRYILSCLPFFILLGAQWLENFYYRAAASNRAITYLGGRVLICLVLSFSILKISYINLMISFPNNLCYF